MNKKTARDTYRSVERHYVPDWLTNRIQIANFDLVDHMIWLLQEDGRFNEILCVERKEIEHFKHNAPSLRNLLRTPFLMIAPTLETVEDWRCFIDETPTTLAVDDLRRKMPKLKALALSMIEHHNRIFVDLITSVIHMNVLAAPLLGITTELANYLVSVPPYKLRLALHRMQGLPLFRWRFNTPTFWYQFTAKTLTDEMVAHHVMQTSPIRTGEMPRGSAWSELRQPREKNEMYAYALMAYKCRASTVSSLFRLNQNAMRQRYVEMHGTSSPCGNLPTSLPWFVETPHNRLHATIFTWLYRAALAAGANGPEALIATNDVYEQLFDGAGAISADRGCNLTRAMAADTRLAIAPCRMCRTHYVVSNNDAKIEMQQSFDCPACNNQLGPKRRGSRSRVSDGQH
ncbi:FlhC family transcriptional regulator [Burkholderia sp. MR1-5-21]